MHSGMGLLVVWTAVYVFCTWETVQALTCAASETQCSDESRCILRHWVCDGEVDCMDGSDEEDCTRCLPARWMCADGNLCIRESWRCDGQADCNDASDERLCDKAGVTLLVTTYYGDVYKINASDGSSERLFQGSNGPTNIAYDHVYKHVYWSNDHTHDILRVNLDGQSDSPVVVTTVDRCEGLVIDSLDRLLFYSDATTRVIGKLDMQYNRTTVIVNSSTSSNRPHDLTADLKNNKLYWTLVGDSPGIEMSDYSGRERVVLLQAGVKPAALSLDFTGTTLFWCDEVDRRNNLMALNLTNRISRPVSSGNWRNFSDIDVLHSTLFLIARNRPGVYLTMPETGGIPETHPLPGSNSKYNVKHIKVISSTSECSHN